MFGRRQAEVVTDEKRIDEVVTRGVAEAVTAEELRAKLSSGNRLRVKLGIDPTSPNIHLGRAVLLLKLRDFQELGHQVVFIVGDATGVVGDTSDKESERPMLTHADVEANLKTYIDQAGKIIDLDKAEVVRNSTWLHKLSFGDIGELADQFSVADFIARDNIRKRLDAGTRVSLREVLYPLMQGYDSVEVKADVEIGGTDQRFNLLAGRVLQEHAGQQPQAFLTVDLIMGTDGRKMSSSWGNTINLTDEPEGMFGKVMRVHDDVVPQYFVSCTRVPMDEVERLQAELASGANPRDAKLRLAREIVTLYHGEAAAQKAEENFTATISNKEEPEDAPDVAISRNDTWLDMLIKSGVVDSLSKARRMPVYVWEEGKAWVAIVAPEEVVSEKYDGRKVKIGKKEFRRIRVTD